MQRYRRRNKGVPKNYKHIWGYRGVWKEKKRGRGKGWDFTFNATKNHKHKGMGSFGIGTKGAWKVIGIQYITKTGKNTYQTKLIGKKYPLKFYVKKPRRRFR
jgi:hypothetical protein